MARNSTPSVLLSVALLAAGGLSSCGQPSPLSSSPSFAAAHAATEAWWPKAEAAFISGNPQMLIELYSGSALDVATGQMTIASLKVSKPKYPRPYRGSVVFGPSDPAVTWFLAIIQFAPVDQDGRAQAITMTAPGMIFTNNAGTWRVSAADVQAPIPHSVFGNGDSTLSGTDTDKHYIMAASAVAAEYASFLNKLGAGQQPEAPFVTGPTSYSSRFTRIEWPPFSIANAQLSFRVDTPQLASYSIPNGGSTKPPEVVVFVMRRTVTLTPKQGCLVRRQGDSWSDIVPAGAYRSVTLISVAVVAATVPLNDGDTSQGRKVIDISGGIDDVAAAGIRC